jgi:hypothetical protein
MLASSRRMDLLKTPRLMLVVPHACLFVTGKQWPFVFQIRVVPCVVSRGAKGGAAR